MELHENHQGDSGGAELSDATTQEEKDQEFLDKVDEAVADDSNLQTPTELKAGGSQGDLDASGQGESGSHPAGEAA